MFWKISFITELNLLANVKNMSLSDEVTGSGV